MSNYYTTPKGLVLDTYTYRITCDFDGGYPDACLFNLGRLNDTIARYKQLFEADENLLSLRVYPEDFFLLVKSTRLDGEIDQDDPSTYEPYFPEDDAWWLEGLYLDTTGAAGLTYQRIDCDDLKYLYIVLKG